MFDDKVVERFMDKVSPEALTGCWLWTGALANDGYGRFAIRLENGKQWTVMAHRMSYMIHKGEIPEGAVIMHHCDTPSCVAPHHLLRQRVVCKNLRVFKGYPLFYWNSSSRATV